ncbi:Membrane magnesium transporter 2 [Hypsizygus marmoreus]|uniref:Membrane magnesium transporter 2 n=1 Tax=Hypsizygus marmoreus TaxID=39966 RepID=A0A369JT20_HYPMA|nr:Membrane magnesium transporter 2 [Hypsizygus marmoreus]
MLGQVLLVLATVAIFHSAFSAYEHLAHLKALGRPEGSLPQSVVVETLIAMVLGILGASLSTPELKEITWASEMRKRKIDEMDSRFGFASFVNRGRNFLVKPTQTAKKIQ